MRLHSAGAKCLTKVARRPEILAPAGDRASLTAALVSGADAVYFGLDDGFNARARAKNFPLSELRETVAEIHRAGARAYITLNTLVFEPELNEVARILRGVAEAGADAIIVQDPAVALLARAIAPTLEVHASTQMTISSARGAAFAKDLGATRFVVPRELSVDEIRKLREGTDLELEVFVHGALCVSWSGQCLTSEAWGGRSANRGQCAQSCRMPYDLVVDGVTKDLGDVKYLLSPKDLVGLPAIPELADIGVHGLKIEGRQKGPQYVATATSAYRDRLENKPVDAREMNLSYTRGSSPGFLAGSDHQTLVEGRFPKHRGVLLGRVINVTRNEAHVAPDKRPWTGGLALEHRTGPRGETKVSLPLMPLITDEAIEPRAGMGVVFDAGNPEDKNEPGGPIFRVTKSGATTILGFGDPGPELSRVRVGDKVWITRDPNLARQAEKLLEQRIEGRIAVDLRVRGRVGESLTISANDVHITSTTLTRATGRGLDEALLREKLGALGGTPFRLSSLAVDLEEDLHLPVSELKTLRRELVQALEVALVKPHAIAAGDPVARVRSEIAEVAPLDESTRLIPLCRSDEQLDAAIAEGVPEVELDWMELVGLSKAGDRARAAGLRVNVAMLRIEKPGEEGITERIARLAPDGVLVRHWGALEYFRGEQPRQRFAGTTASLIGDFSLNVTNSITARYLLARGLDIVTASFDLDDVQLYGLLDNTPRGRVAVVVHHRIPTFHTEHCLYAHLLSEGRDYRTCGRPCESRRVDVRDHLGKVHPVIVDAGCRNTVFNADAQSAATLVPTLLTKGVRRFRVDFVRESRDEARKIIATYRALLEGRIAPADVARKLQAREQFGVGQGTRTLIELRSGPALEGMAARRS